MRAASIVRSAKAFALRRSGNWSKASRYDVVELRSTMTRVTRRLWTCGRRRELLGTLQIGERQFVHFIDDLRVRARRRFEPGPRDGLWRLAVGVEVHIEVASADDAHEPEEMTEI